MEARFLRRKLLTTVHAPRTPPAPPPQCVTCEDWFHLEHIQGMPRDEAFQDTFNAFVCKACTGALPFLKHAVLANDTAEPDGAYAVCTQPLG